MPIHKTTLAWFLFFLLFSSTSQSAERTLKISGLKVYKEDQLVKALDLQRYNSREMNAEAVIYFINTFYKEQGYTIVKIYVLENTKTSLWIYVDEGRLGKIIFKNLDDINTLWARYNFGIDFGLKGKVFNQKIVERNAALMKKQRNYSDVRWELKPAKTFDSSLIQLDRELNLPIIGKSHLPLFDRFARSHDLEITMGKRPVEPTKNEGDKKKITVADLKNKRIRLHKLDFGLKMIWNMGFIPYARYAGIGIITPGDGIRIGTDLGIMYALDRKFEKPPRFTFFKGELTYLFTPTFENFFTPYIRSFYTRSKTARPDVGLLQYDYQLMSVMFAPGITLLRKYLIHIGVGEEIANFLNSKNYPPYLWGYSPPFYISFKNLWAYYTYFETGIAATLKPERFGNPIKQHVVAVFDFYVGKTYFYKFLFDAHFDFEFKDRSIYTVMLNYKFMWKHPPLYHEANTSSMEFKGLMKRYYYTRNALTLSNEYKISLYRDFFYAGLYNDYTLFIGSGYNLPVRPYFAAAAGPTIRLLLLDQFEFYFYYGWDVITRKHVTIKDVGTNYTFNLFKKW